MARREYSEETKAQVMAALLAGQSVNSAAREYKIPKGTISHWRNTATGKVAESVTVEDGSESDRTQKSASLDELLLSYVETNLETLRAQSESFKERQWLSRQQASELAVLHGDIADKTIRILEAYGGGSGNA